MQDINKNYRKLFPSQISKLKIIESNFINYTHTSEHFHYGKTITGVDVILIAISFDCFKPGSNDANKNELYYNYIKSLQDFDGFDCSCKYLGLYWFNNAYFLVFESFPSLDAFLLQNVDNANFKLYVLKELLRIFSYLYENEVYLPLITPEVLMVDRNRQFRLLYMGNVCNLKSPQESISILDPRVWNMLEVNYKVLSEFVRDNFSGEGVPASQRNICSKFFIYQLMLILKRLFRSIDELSLYPSEVKIHILNLVKEFDFRYYLNSAKNITEYYTAFLQCLVNNNINFDIPTRKCPIINYLPDEVDIKKEQIIPINRERNPITINSLVITNYNNSVDSINNKYNNSIIKNNIYINTNSVYNNIYVTEKKNEEVTKEKNYNKEEDLKCSKIEKKLKKISEFMDLHFSNDIVQERDEADIIDPRKLPLPKPYVKPQYENIIDLRFDEDISTPRLIWNPDKLSQDIVYSYLATVEVNWPQAMQVKYDNTIALSILNEFDYNIVEVITKVLNDVELLTYYIKKFN
jgi:hypothetical protein